MKKPVRVSLAILAGLFVASNDTDAASSFKHSCDIPDTIPLIPFRDKSLQITGDRTQPIRLLSWNIQNLPDLLTDNPDYAENRMECVGQLAANYDLVAFQENFLLRRPQPAGLREYPSGVSSAYLTNASGLSFFTRSLPLQNFSFTPYTVCATPSGDCLARKGFMRATIKGTTIITTHMDAGRGEEDRQARLQQLTELATAIPEQGPVVLSGDFNLRYEETGPLHAFLRANNLTLQVRHDKVKGIDIIATREVEVLSAGYIPQGNLSDHDGLTFTFRPRT